jgi:CRISPR-associated protein Csm1
MNSNDRGFQTVVLAALLHDIGKFAQRTGRHTGLSHPEMSTRFCSEFLGPDWQDVTNAVGYHHLRGIEAARDQHLALTLVLADWLSSGERRPLPEGETGEPANDALISVFSTLRASSESTRYPLQALPADGSLVPVPSATAGKEAYAGLWDSFVAECQSLSRTDFRMLSDQLLALLEKYTMFVPSAAWRSETDISLYHHLKSTAAIASCLYHDGLDAAALNEQLTAFDNPAGSGRAVAYLVGGDVSGIQGFIYNLRAKGALKSLRGRSLYLQLIPEAVASSLLDALSLTRANIIYCGGGHFYLLAPATAKTNEAIENYARTVDQTLLSAHGGRLSLALATQPLRLGDFSGKDFGNAWDKLHDKLARAKKQRFSRLLAAGKTTKVLGPRGIGGEPKACSVCGVESAERDEEDRCPLCASFAGLSADLRNAGVVAETASSRRYDQPRAWHEVMSNLGREYRFLPEAHATGAAWLLNGTGFAASGLNGFRFLAKHVPEIAGETATLEDIAKGADGIQRWGVLRADVDNLGNTFKEGLGDNRSISRLSVLSSLLSYFFSARVQAIAQEGDFKDKVYLAYSGGDDLFALGPWSVLPDFAERIKDEFARFTSERLTLSAGIFVAPSDKFPVYEAADLAGDAESKAKSENPKEKNRLNFLGSTVRWSELDDVRAVKDDLVGLLTDGLPKSILGILRSSWQQQKEAGDGQIPMYPIWRLLYAFKRLKTRSNIELTQRIDELEHKVVAGNGLHPHLDLIIRWAEYEVRR